MGTIAQPAVLAREICRQLEVDDALEAVVCRLVERAQSDDASFSPSAAALARQLSASLEEHAQEQWHERIDRLDAADLWFCAALAEGDAEAVQRFEQRLGPEIEVALRRFSLSDDQRTELAQHVRVRLLVGNGETPPRIAMYRGWGSLEGWTRTITARLALNAIRDRKGAQPLERAPQLIGASPEFAAMRASRRTLFMQALRQAFQSLGARERTLLRLRYLDGVQANTLAGSYDVHESTMSRWLASARTQLETRFSAEAKALVRDDAAVTELLGAMQSRFGQSLEELFESTTPE